MIATLKGKNVYFYLCFRFILILCLVVFNITEILFFIRLTLIPLILLLFVFFVWVLFAVILDNTTLRNIKQRYIYFIVVNAIYMLLLGLVIVIWELYYIDVTSLITFVWSDIVFSLWLKISTWDELMKSVYPPITGTTGTGGNPGGPGGSGGPNPHSHFCPTSLHEDERFKHQKEGYTIKWYLDMRARYGYAPHTLNRIIQLSEKSGYEVHKILRRFSIWNTSEADIFERFPVSDGYVVFNYQNSDNTVFEGSRLNLGNNIALKISTLLHNRFKDITTHNPVHRDNIQFVSIDGTVTYGQVKGILSQEEKDFLLNTIVNNKSEFTNNIINAGNIRDDFPLISKRKSWGFINKVIKLNQID